MATRLNKRQSDSAKQLIQAQRIIQEMHRVWDGELKKTAQQMRAAEVLLSYSLAKPPVEQVTYESDKPPDFYVIHGD